MGGIPRLWNRDAATGDNVGILMGGPEPVGVRVRSEMSMERRLHANHTI
jgi:hypothetical protein